MNRIYLKNIDLKRNKKKAFVAYITAGFPNIRVTEKLIYTLEKNGADFIELGMPFSDPVADGPTIQEASFQALKAGITLEKLLDLVKKVRRKTQVPLIIMSYYNPIFRYGIKNFAVKAAKAGIDGLIIPDLPPEESIDLNETLADNDICQIFLISPVTNTARKRKIAISSRGFIYYVPLTGVTGVRSILPGGIKRSVAQIRKFSKTPVFVGFGISTPVQVKQVGSISDGVIVGSGIIRLIRANLRSKDMIKKVGRYVNSLSRVCSKS
jgi:tryptophan synthase alpha chain